MEAVLNEHREHEKNLQSTLIDRAEARGRHQGERRTGSAAHHPRGRGPLGPAAREDAGAARGHPARDRRAQAEAQGRRDVDRSEHPDAAQHARVRPRAGSARARRQDPAPSAAPTSRSAAVAPRPRMLRRNPSASARDVRLTMHRRMMRKPRLHSALRSPGRTAIVVLADFLIRQRPPRFSTCAGPAALGVGAATGRRAASLAAAPAIAALQAARIVFIGFESLLRARSRR